STIMERFRGPIAPNNPTDLDIAAAYLDIAPGERGLIFSGETVQQFQYWGEVTNAAAIAKYTRVDAFLDRTGLSYQDVLTLLTLDFISPKGKIAIQHLDTSCDTSQKRIQP